MTAASEIKIPLHRPGLKEKIFFLASGIIVSVPLTLLADQLSGYLTSSMTQFYATLISVVIFTPFIEEFAKAYPLFYRHGEMQRSLFTLGLLAGLGFGIAEFSIYVFIQGVPFYVRLPAVFFHAASTSITAYGVATKRILPFYLVAVLLHLSNNALAEQGTFWLVGGPLVLIAAYFLSWYLYGKTSEKIVF